MMNIKKVKFVMQIRQVENSEVDCSLIYNLSNDPLVRSNRSCTIKFAIWGRKKPLKIPKCW